MRHTCCTSCLAREVLRINLIVETHGRKGRFSVLATRVPHSDAHTHHNSRLLSSFGSSDRKMDGNARGRVTPGCARGRGSCKRFLVEANIVVECQRCLLLVVSSLEGVRRTGRGNKGVVANCRVLIVGHPYSSHRDQSSGQVYGSPSPMFCRGAVKRCLSLSFFNKNKNGFAATAISTAF